MPNATTEETKDATDRARTSTRVQRPLDEPTPGTAIRDVVTAWVDTVRLFIPPIALQPEAGVRVLADAVGQVFELQRRFLEEFISVSHQAVTSTAVDQLRLVQTSVNGGSRP